MPGKNQLPPEVEAIKAAMDELAGQRTRAASRIRKPALKLAVEGVDYKPLELVTPPRDMPRLRLVA